LKVAIYARYSSDNQRDASIADQLRVCREFAARQRWKVVEEFTDHAISGSTLLRSGFQALMRDPLNQRFDVVLAEALDRFSRDQEDTAGLFKRLTFAGVNIVTLAEGDITHLHVGLKGTMNALFLKDLADKTRRGLRGRVEVGKSGGGLCYGYKVTRARPDGVATTGDREIVAAEAEVIRRIFRDYAAGLSPSARQAIERGRLSRTGWRTLESQHYPRQSGPRHRNLEQRAVRRAPRVESPALREGSGHGEARFAPESTIRLGNDFRSRAANRGR
jgi:DNA invertase Pin-like site-specific DNA recombinase